MKPNYQYEKRQRDLRKLQKKEEKRLRKLAGTEAPGESETGQSGLPDEPKAPASESEVKG